MKKMSTKSILSHAKDFIKFRKAKRNNKKKTK